MSIVRPLRGISSKSRSTKTPKEGVSEIFDLEKVALIKIPIVFPARAIFRENASSNERIRRFAPRGHFAPVLERERGGLLDIASC